MNATPVIRSYDTRDTSNTFPQGLWDFGKANARKHSVGLRGQLPDNLKLQHGHLMLYWSAFLTCITWTFDWAKHIHPTISFLHDSVELVAVILMVAAKISDLNQIQCQKLSDIQKWHSHLVSCCDNIRAHSIYTQLNWWHKSVYLSKCIVDDLCWTGIRLVHAQIIVPIWYQVHSCETHNTLVLFFATVHL